MMKLLQSCGARPGSRHSYEDEVASQMLTEYPELSNLLGQLIDDQ